jgi:hypothetical protein
MTDSENRCENCKCVDRCCDEYSHQCYRVSNRCPMYEMLVSFQKINLYPCPIEIVTGYTGCKHFEEDMEYKRQNEEDDKLIAEMDAKRRTNNV